MADNTNIPRLEDMLQVNYNPQELYDVLLSFSGRIQQLELKVRRLEKDAG